MHSRRAMWEDDGCQRHLRREDGNLRNSVPCERCLYNRPHDRRDLGLLRKWLLDWDLESDIRVRTMRRSVSNVATLLTALAVLLSAPAFAGPLPQKPWPKPLPPEKRDVTIASFEVEGLSGMEALAKLSAQTGLPLGIEWVGVNPGPQITHRWSNEKASAIATDIAYLTSPLWHYGAQVRNGVLEVRPDPGLARGHSVADHVVPAFALRHDTEPSAAVRLRDLVNCSLVGGCGGAEIFMAAGGEEIPDRSFRNSRVADILDYLVTAGNTIRIWVLVEDSHRRIGTTAYWQTQQIYFKPIPLSVQPWWTLLPWRESPAPRAIGGAWPCPRCWTRPPPKRPQKKRRGRSPE